MAGYDFLDELNYLNREAEESERLFVEPFADVEEEEEEETFPPDVRAAVPAGGLAAELARHMEAGYRDYCRAKATGNPRDIFIAYCGWRHAVALWEDAVIPER